MSKVETVFSRRALLAYLSGFAGAAAAQDLVTIPGKRPMILHNDRPEDLETPLNCFDTWLTPNDAFFVRQHLPRPQIDEARFQVSLDGRLSKPMSLSVADLRKLPQHKVPATLECTGDGRGFFRPRVPGIQWGRGAIGNAEWAGPRLSDVLKLAGVDENAAYVTVNGADAGVAKTPDFIRSFPMKKALQTETLLALNMNGEPLPALHGFPVRLVVPGWDGTSWVKWVTTLSVSDEPDKGFFMNPAYRFPKHPGVPGAPVSPADLAVIQGMPVKSYIMTPSDQAQIPVSAVSIQGVAWAGEQRIERVEVSTDGGRHWENAKLSSQNLPFAWRLWSLTWTPESRGYYTLMSRATDSAGNVQPITATWNPSGYLYNAIDQIGVTVEEK